MPLSETKEQDFLKYFIARTTIPVIGNLYVALATGGVSKTSAGTEVSGGSYARKLILETVWEVTLTGSDITTTSDVEFATATGSWGTVTTATFHDALTAGNYLGFITLASSKTIISGETAKFASGDLTLTFS